MSHPIEQFSFFSHSTLSDIMISLQITQLTCTSIYTYLEDAQMRLSSVLFLLQVVSIEQINGLYAMQKFKVKSVFRKNTDTSEWILCGTF